MPAAARILGALGPVAARAAAIALVGATFEWLLVAARGEMLAPAATAAALWSLNLFVALPLVLGGEALIALLSRAGLAGPWLPWRADPRRAASRAAVVVAAAAATLVVFGPLAKRVEVSVARAANRVLLLGAVALLAAGAGALAGALAWRWLSRKPIERPRMWLAAMAAVAIAGVAVIAALNRRMLGLLDVRLVVAVACLCLMIALYSPLRRLRWPPRAAAAALVWALFLGHLPLGIGPLARGVAARSYGVVALRGAQSRLAMQLLDHLLPGPPMRASRFPFRQTKALAGEPVARNLVLVTVDALRADHVGAYGYRRPTTPSVDRFFASAIRFERCYTSSPATVPGLVGMLYGLYPTRATWRKHYDPYVDHIDGRNVAERLAAAGFTTSFVTFHTYKPLHQEALVAGFRDHVQNPKDGERGEWLTPRDRRMAAAVVELFESLDRDPGRHFVWLHFSDPHERYLRHLPPASFGSRPMDRYDGEIRFTDSAFATVSRALEATRWGKDAVVIFSADHGEAFGEHGSTYHGHSTYEEELRVPCLVRFPGSRPAVVDTAVSTVDVAPTILDLLGVADEQPFDGVSWGPALRRGEALPERDLFAMVYLRGVKQYAVVHGWLKAMFSPDGRFRVAYDLKKDAGEKKPVSLGPARVQALTDRLAGWLGATRP